MNPNQTNYIYMVDDLHFEPVTPEVWETIQNEGLDEEQQAPNQNQWGMATLPITEEDSKNLQELSDAAIEKFNLFDIALKEKFGGRIVDLVDYDKGVVRLVKVMQPVKQASVEYPPKVTGKWLNQYMTKLHYGSLTPAEFKDRLKNADWGEDIANQNWKLVNLPLSEIDNPHDPDELLAEDYSEINSPFPPIVVDRYKSIIDGSHRYTAAVLRGDGKIRAYVPSGAPKTSSFYFTIPLGQLRAPITKVAISVPELVAQTNAFSVKRRPNCEASLLDSNPKQLYLHYKVKCHESYSDPAGHDVSVKFDVSKVEETQNANDLDVQLNCSCPAFLYWGAQWNLHQRDGLLGEPRPKLVAPTQRLDLRGNFVICKHCKTVLERILPAVQHNIINIIREKTVEKNKEKKKQTPEKLKNRQEEMKKRLELKKIRETKNKAIQKKLLDALRKREEEKTIQEAEHEEDLVRVEEGENPELVGRDKPATLPVIETPKRDDVTKEEPKGEEDYTGLVEKEEHKLKQKEHKKLKNKPHLHHGLPYETEEEKQEHGHKVPTDTELMNVLDKKVDNKKNLKRKQTSIEASMLAALVEVENESRN